MRLHPLAPEVGVMRGRRIRASQNRRRVLTDITVGLRLHRLIVAQDAFGLELPCDLLARLQRTADARLPCLPPSVVAEVPVAAYRNGAEMQHVHPFALAFAALGVATVQATIGEE